MGDRKPAGVFPATKSNVRWTVWDNSPKNPTVSLRAQWYDKVKEEYVEKKSLFLEELKKLIAAGAEAVELMESLMQEQERKSALGSDAVPFEFPSSLDDDSIDF